MPTTRGTLSSCPSDFLLSGLGLPDASFRQPALVTPSHTPQGPLALLPLHRVTCVTHTRFHPVLLPGSPPPLHSLLPLDLAHHWGSWHPLSCSLGGSEGTTSWRGVYQGRVQSEPGRHPCLQGCPRLCNGCCHCAFRFLEASLLRPTGWRPNGPRRREPGRSPRRPTGCAGAKRTPQASGSGWEKLGSYLGHHGP